MAAAADSREHFILLSSKITQLSYGRSKNDRNVISETLDELNSLNYKYTVVTNPTQAVLLVNQCCALIPPEDLELVLKCCNLITSLVARQTVVIDGRTLTVAVQWCLQALNEENANVDILVALDVLLRNNTKHGLIGKVVKNTALINLATNEKCPELAFFALQCLDACTIPPEDMKGANSNKFTNEFKICFNIFLNHTVNYYFATNNLIGVKIYIVCLRGLQNIIRQEPELLSDNLGIVLGVIKSYMSLGIPGIEFVKPPKLMPSPLCVPETNTNVTREKGGKMTKHRKPKTQAAITKVKKSEKWDDDKNVGGYTPAVSMNNSEEGYSSFGHSAKTSDSDFSDTEGGNIAKLNVTTGRVRQAALGLFLHTVKLTDKAVMFSYWSNFIPENPLYSQCNLITCILKETSNRGSMAALNALLILLSSSKLFLAQAEKGENLAFTPFSVILGYTVKELHKCLCLALSAHSVPILALVLKCFAALVQATPYHRLSPGLITKVVRNVKPFIYHKDYTVQVTALIVLGCTLASEPLIPETKEAFIKRVEPRVSQKKLEIPRNSGGALDVSSEDEELTVANTDIPWLLERCFANLGVNAELDNVPTPVKLESLQILSVMSRNYFETLLVPHLSLVTKALDISLSSKYADVQLHAGRAVDFIGQAMNRCFAREGDRTVSPHQCLPFWQTLFNNSLTALLCEQQPILRAIGCDCLGSIGPDIFEQFPRDKQILCVTLLFAASHDEENSVKGAAVRALAICVMYPSLREDSGFVVDTTEAIYRVMQDENFNVRVKCSWALGNLSDALVLNKSTPHLMEEFPKNLLLKLLNTTIRASNDGDKIKMNTVRALGNLLQMIDGDLMQETSFKESTENGINILVKSCISGSNMKVRWNSCYALGNAMKNPFLYSMNINWQEKVFNALSDLVVNFRNFKVRINASVALSSPRKREYYRQFYHSVWVSLVKGLETAQNMEDFSEYKHRDNLIEQICLSLGHLMCLMTKEDLILLKDSIHSDHLKVQIRRIWEIVLPEKSTTLFDARTHIASLSNEPDLSLEQKKILHCLTDILTQGY